LPALVAFVLFLVGTWRLARRAHESSSADGDVDGRRLALAVQSSLVVAVTSACFLSVQIALPLWLLGGLAVVLNTSAGVQPVTPLRPVRVAAAG
jgi:hypothetical protein